MEVEKTSVGLERKRVPDKFYISVLLIFLCNWTPCSSITINPLESIPTCNRSRAHITNSTWGLISDGYGNYTHDSHCEWLIQADDPGSIITLLIHTLKTECSYDYLFLFDGKSYRDAKLLASLSGATKPLQPFVAYSGYLLVVLYSDTNYVLEGFVGEYFITPCSLDCPSLKSCTGESKCDCIQEVILDPFSNETRCTSPDFSNSPNLQYSSANVLKRVGHSAIRYGNQLFIYGGFDLNEILNDLIVLDLTDSSYTKYTKVQVQKGELWPSAGHFGHAAASFVSGFFVHGGRTENGISSDFYYFNITTSHWTKYTNNLLPKLMYHTMSEGPDGIFYVYGGGSPSGTFSNQLYKFSVKSPGEWSLIQTGCCGKEKDRSILGHTMNYWPKKNALIMFGGLVADVGRFSKLSTQLWIFLIDSSTWIPIEYRRPPSEQNTERAFATSLLIGDHLVVIGGYSHAHNRDETCYANHILVYNLECYVLVPEVTLEESLEGLFGHQSILLEQKILVMGGYRGYLNRKVSSISIPLSLTTNSTECKSYDRRWRCVSERRCGWCPTDDRCYEKLTGTKNCTTNLQTSQCPGICTLLKTCQACASLSCTWCESTEQCFRAEDTPNGYTDPCPERYLRTNLTSCVHLIERHALTLVEYRNPPNFFHPDSVRAVNVTTFHLAKESRPTETSSNDVVLVGVRGFLVDALSPLERLEMCVFHCLANLRMEQGPESDRETLTISAEWAVHEQSCTNLSWSSGLPVSVLPGAKISVDINITSGLAHEKSGRVLLRHNLKLFRKENLLSYSSNSVACPTFKTCMHCIGDSSCLWYNSNSTCGSRRNWSNSTPSSVTLVFEECSICSDFTSCTECTSTKHDCEWTEDDATCARRGKSGSSVTNPARCAPECNLRTSCSSCLDPAGACVWCAQTQECFVFSVYTSFYQYGQCIQWKDKKGQCNECFNQTTCENCIQYMGCGWSYTGDSGTCLEGDFAGHYSQSENAVAVSNSSWAYLDCPDVDECLLKLHDCHPEALCINTQGSYTCQCKQGFTGDGKVSCYQTCYEPCVHGTCTENYVCHCDLGWTGVDCSIDCGCYNHSSCETGACDKCEDYTQGKNCEECAPASYGNATVEGQGCRACQCNDHGDPTRGYCNRTSGDCFCLNHTAGRYCSKCQLGYYGNPADGRPCFKECSGRALMNSTVGYFGLEGKIDSRGAMEHCMWIINPAPEDDQTAKHIRITISADYQIPCVENALKIYAGLPSFSTPTRNALLVASICSYVGDRSHDPITVDINGNLGTVLLQHPRGGHHRAKFNATYRIISEDDAEIDTRSIRPVTDMPLPIKSLSNGKSVLSRFGFTLFSDEKNVFIFGGFSFSHGLLNDVRQFRRDVEQWVPLTITVVQNEDSVPLGRYFHAGALGPNSEIFIHGGMTYTSFLSDTWKFDTRLSRWKRLFRESNKTSSLRLAGHTLTLRSVESEALCQLVIIGGMNPWSGFSNKVYMSSCVEPVSNWEVVNTTGTSPIGIYGHTTVYHRGSDTFYVFGGIVSERDEVNISPTLFALHWPTKRWTLLPPNYENQIDRLPSPRFLHSAVSTDSYMIVAGGSGSPRRLSMMAYVYACNLWIRVGHDRVMETSGAGVSVSEQELLLMGGWDGSSAIESLSSISLPTDLCSIHKEDELCKATLGCSFCSSNRNESQCYSSTLEMPAACSSGASKRVPIEFWRGITCSTQWMGGRNCTQYQTCSDCLATWPSYPNASQACQWCTNCQIGRCVQAGRKCPDEVACGQKQRETTDSVNCPERLCSASECEKCVASGRCIWTRQILRSSEWSFQLHSQPVYNWNCVRKSILDTKPSFSVSSSPPDKCPNPCVSHQTCAECLDSPGSEGGFQECHWSVTLNTCISPAHKFIRCFGGVCGPILRGQSTNCPKPCSAHTSCSTCLEAPDCGWCATEGRNGEGRCVSGSSVSADAEECPAGSWNYLVCPKENECLNGHHKCDTESENCIDLDEGHACLCRDGYKKYRDTCIPICDEGCVHGDCTAPNKCTCHFGFVGSNCSAECNCNGHSHCAGEHQLDTCLKCMNNTMGPQCTRCLPMFIGDPKNGGTCIPCNEYCNGHSDVCLSWTLHQKWCNGSLPMTTAQLMSRLAEEEEEPGPLTAAYCCTCKNYTTNSKCDDCIPGYFRGSEEKRNGCRKCECHGHGNHCDSVSGENCNCHNNTESDHCSGSGSLKGQCWKQQCSKCREYYLGVPTNGHQCYRQMHVDSEYFCFSDSQDSCAKPKPLLSGKTVFFAVQPKFMNVNIRINLDVTHGAVHVYLSPKEDTFVIRQDVNTWNHVVRYDIKYGLTGDHFDGSNQNYMPANLTDSGMSLKSVLPESYRKEELEAAGFTTHVTLTDPKSVLVVRNLRNRLVITLPQDSHDLRLTRFYIVMEGIGDVSYGNIFFRQDQLHIDLFVFFSVFFSAFFLFLAACGVAWKVKQNVESRRARQRQMQMAKQMAKRPFAIWTLILEPETTSPLYEIYRQCRKSCRKGCICLRPVAVEPIRDGNAAICSMFVALPGGPTAPCRLALASALANNPQSFNTHVRRRRL